MGLRNVQVADAPSPDECAWNLQEAPDEFGRDKDNDGTKSWFKSPWKAPGKSWFKPPWKSGKAAGLGVETAPVEQLLLPDDASIDAMAATPGGDSDPSCIGIAGVVGNMRMSLS